jgi:diguanylate cyclase (GGDEF)-like protein
MEGSEHLAGPEELRGLSILAGVGEVAAWGGLLGCPVRRLDKGARLLTRGAPNDHMFFVLSGRLGIYLEDAAPEPVASLGTGQTVGEMSVIDGSAASANVVATEPSRLLEVDGQTFWRLVNSSHQFAINLLTLLAGRMRANNTSLERAAHRQHELEHDATVDALTGLFNRRWWDRRFQRLVTRAHHGQSPLGLAVIDVDHFKRFNDTFGHMAGDRVLSLVAGVLSNHLRPTDLVARFGGEEFVVALPGTLEPGVAAVADRLRVSVASAQPCCEEGQTLPPVTISVGLATLLPGESAEELFRRADAALYRAKRAGRNRVEYDTPA